MPLDRADIYQTITDQIVEQLEQGVRPWVKPWSAEHAAGRITRPLRHNGIPYNGVNTILLWMAADAKGYNNPIWMTYKQADALGGQVRKGEKSTPVTYADKIKRTNKETGEDENIFFLKTYSAFNVEQIDSLPAHYYALKDLPKLDAVARDAKAEEFFKNIKADIGHGGSRAYYSQTSDRIQMPPFETFKEPEGYYTTLAHEAVHWTKHPARLARDFGRKKWGDEGYAMEEMSAEIGAAFLAADLGLSLKPRAEHAAYLASWLKVLKEDKRAIFQTASHATKAADYLHGLQPKLEQAVDHEKPAPATILALPSPEAPPGRFAAQETRRREVKGQGRLL